MPQRLQYHVDVNEAFAPRTPRQKQQRTANQPETRNVAVTPTYQQETRHPGTMRQKSDITVASKSAVVAVTAKVARRMTTKNGLQAGQLNQEPFGPF
jgi:hypothetical protein